MPQNNIKNIGRPDERAFIVSTKILADPESYKKFITSIPSNVDVQFKDLENRTPDKHNRQRVVDEDGVSYSEFMTTSCAKGVVKSYIQETPGKSPYSSRTEVRFAGIPPIGKLKEINPDLFEHRKTSHFSFNITPADIERRRGVKRPITQKKAFGCSSRDLFEEYGAIIVEETHKFHLAHRQGWSLAGSQTKDNLDPATAGSNYATLFTIESPLKHLLIEGDIDNMQVDGEVIFHPLLIEFPMEIIYTLSWGNNRTARVSIYPLEYRSPVKSELNVATALLNAVRSPTRPQALLSPGRNSFFASSGESVPETNICVNKILFSNDPENIEPDDLSGRVDNSSLQPLRPAACPRDPEILSYTQTYCAWQDRNRPREQVARRGNENCQQTMVSSKRIKSGP